MKKLILAAFALVFSIGIFIKKNNCDTVTIVTLIVQESDES